MKTDNRKQVIVRMPEDLNLTIKANYQKWGFNNINEFIINAIDKSINSHFNSTATNNEFLIDDFSNTSQNLFDLTQQLKSLSDEISKKSHYLEYNDKLLHILFGIIYLTNVSFLNLKKGGKEYLGSIVKEALEKMAKMQDLSVKDIFAWITNHE